MTGVLFSSAAWVLIPPITSIVCSFGLYAARRIIGITHQELARHSDNRLYPAARYMHTNAHFRARVLGLILAAGVLVTIPQLAYGILPPPHSGWWWCLWANHYLVGITSMYLTVTAFRAYHARRVFSLDD